MQTEIQRIVDELTRVFGGDAWYGFPVKQILDGVTAQQASARPIPAAHSIYELVLHLTGWKKEVRRRLSGTAAGDPDEGDWPPVTDSSPAGWRAALSALDSAHEALVAAVRVFPDSKLNEPINDSREGSQAVSYYVLLHGAAQHDVYHSAQMSLLKKGVR
jgi:uncharacterized damage-inducible protein DinB